MSHRLSWSLVSVGSASVGLLAAGIMVYAAGCGQSVEGLNGTKGPCPATFDDNNPCTDDECTGGAVKHDPKSDGTACAMGKNRGTCGSGVCNLSCMSTSSGCTCDTPEDCPMATECQEWVCPASRCELNLEKTGSPIATQTEGDCKSVVCTAEGGTTITDDATDTPADKDACHVGTCQAGMPGYASVKVGDPCGDGKDGVCDSSEKCVPCLEGTGTGCTPGEMCYKTTAGELACTTCSNGTKDASEADTDCGGACAQCLLGGPCKSCELGKTCNAGSDCANTKPCVDGVCCESVCAGVCQACSPGSGHCDDLPTGAVDPNCPAADGKVCAYGVGCVFRAGHACTYGTDCTSGTCSLSKCNKGGPLAPCIDGTDCTSGTCQMDHTCM
jgi:hypothetical protein